MTPKEKAMNFLKIMVNNEDNSICSDNQIPLEKYDEYKYLKAWLIQVEEAIDIAIKETRVEMNKKYNDMVKRKDEQIDNYRTLYRKATQKKPNVQERKK